MAETAAVAEAQGEGEESSARLSRGLRSSPGPDLGAPEGSLEHVGLGLGPGARWETFAAPWHPADPCGPAPPTWPSQRSLSFTPSGGGAGGPALRRSVSPRPGRGQTVAAV